MLLSKTSHAIRRLALCVLVCCAGPALTGCGSMRPADADAAAPGLDLGSRSRGEAPFAADRAISGDPIVATYRRYSGGSATPSKRAGEIRVVPGEDGSWWTERWLLPSSAGRSPTLERRVRLGRGADGSILLLESSGGEEALTTVFDPPIRLAAALMAPGEAFEDDFRVRILDADGDEVRTGEGSATVRFAGRQRINTPLGTFDADLLLTDMTIESGMATVVRRQRQWIATVRPGRTMIVAEDVGEQVSVFGFNRNKRHRLAIEAIVR